MKIVILDGEALNPGDVSWDPLSRLGETVVHKITDSREFPERVRGADVVLVNKTLIRAPEIAALGDCKLVGVLATGTNNVDLPALAQAGVKVCNVPAYGVEDVAQHTLALLMELTRNISLHSESIKAGEWSENGKWCYWLKTPFSLYGLTLGIIGFGSIGQAMGRLGHALGMRIITPTRKTDINPGYPFTKMAIGEIWKNADVISLHCPLTPQTEKIINESSLAAMKKGSILINTARGPLVDEEAVANALKDGKLAGFGADVMCSEPPAGNNPLLTAPNTLLTPHIAWATTRARQKIIDIMANNIKSFFACKPVNIVN